jgi:WD40 repeat protein
MRWWIGLCLGAILLGLTTVQADEMPSEIAYDLDWHPDGSVLAVAASEHIWLFLPSNEVLTKIPYPALVDPALNTPNRIEWSSDGIWLATLHRNGVLRVWNYPEQQLVIDTVLKEDSYGDSIRWHPTEPVLSTYDHLVNVVTGEVTQPFTYDVYWGRSTNDPPVNQEVTGEVYWSADASKYIRRISSAGCGPCAEYGVFDSQNDTLLTNLGADFGGDTTFLWSADGRYRYIDPVHTSDYLFDSQIERVVILETGAFEYSRMPALHVLNSIDESNIKVHTVTYPDTLFRIDWISNVPYGVTALSCSGALVTIDIRDMSFTHTANLFQKNKTNETCDITVSLGYSNP